MLRKFLGKKSLFREFSDFQVSSYLKEHLSMAAFNVSSKSYLWKILVQVFKF